MTRIRRKNHRQEKKLWSDFYESQKKQHKEGEKETPELKKARLHKLKWDYNHFCEYYFDEYMDAKNAQYHEEIAYKILENEKINLFTIIHRKGAKSTHVNLFIPVWLQLFHKELFFMVLIGETIDKAKQLLKDLQNTFETNERLIEDFGELMSTGGDWKNGEFKTTNGTFFKAVSLGQNIRGLRNFQYRPDYISVDDVEDRAKAKNQFLVAEKVDRLLGAVKGSFGKKRQRFIICNNFIHKKGIIAHLIQKLKAKKRTKFVWRDAYVNPPENNKYLKALVEDERVDITYKAPGAKDYTSNWPSQFSMEYWKEEEGEDSTNYTFIREMLNNPVEEGLIFLTKWYREIATPMKDWGKFEKIVGYGDLSYKRHGDFKAVAVVGLLKGKYYLLDVFVKQTIINEVAEYIYEIEAAKPSDAVIHWYVEGSFAQDGFVDDIDDYGQENYGYVLDILPDESSKPDKYERVARLANLFQKLLFFFNSLLRDTIHMEEAKDQFTFFAKNSGYPDDLPDAVEGAITKIKELIRKGEESSEIFMGDYGTNQDRVHH